MKKIFCITLFSVLTLPAFSSTDSLQAVKKWGKWLCKFDLQPGDTIVSLGAGNGWREFELSLLANGLNFVLEDLDSVALNQANLNKNKIEFSKGRKTALTSTFQTIYGTTQTIPVQNALANKVMIMNAYHHFDNKDVMLKEIHRVLKPGGRLIITDHVSLTISKESTYGCDRKYFMLNQKDLVDQIVRSNFKLVSVTSMAKQTRIFIFEKVEQPKITRTQGTNQFDQVRCGLQDKAGNLWFGTTGEGVYCFDGKSFTNFTVKNGLSSNTIWSVLEDKTGNLWFGTDSGLCRYDGKSFVSVPISVNHAGYSSFNYFSARVLSSKPVVWCILQDKSGKIWFATNEGVYCYDGTVFTFFLNQKGLINPDQLQLNTVGYMLEDKNGNIWLGSGMPAGTEGLCRYDPVSGNLTCFKPGGETWIRYIVEDKNGVLWLGTRQKGVWRYNGEAFSRYTDKEGIGAPVLLDGAGNIWFTGEEHENGFEGKGGVWCYDGQYFKNYSDKDGMGNYGVWCIIKDRDGNIWFGTRNIGLYRYDGKKFTSFSE